MTRLPLRTTIVLVCLGIVALISITVPQTFSKNLVTPRMSSFLAGASTPIHAKNLAAPRVSNALQVAAGGDHTCAIQTNGSVKCWGSNWAGQLGYGDMRQRGDEPGQMGTNLPIVDLGPNTATQISAGAAHTCVILNDSTLKCWGLNDHNQLGYGDSINHGDDSNEMGINLPVINLGTTQTARTVSAGVYHTCAILSDYTLKCWGNNANGQLGYGDNVSLDTPSASPVDLGSGHTAVAVSAGLAHTCAILNDATVRCWGDNTYGQLGMGNITPLTAPSATAVDLGNHIAMLISSRGNHTCVVLEDFTAKCWGYNNVGQLGLGDTYNRGDDTGEMGTDLPTINLGSGRTARAIVTSPRSDLGYTCALLDDASVKCWGENGFGQLGQGDYSNRGVTSTEMTNLNAVDVGTNQTVASISIGAAHSCVVLLSTNIKCWGFGAIGRLGSGNWQTIGRDPNQMGDNLPQVDLDGVVATATPTTETSTPSDTPTLTETITPVETRTPTQTRTPSKTLTPSKSLTPSKTFTRSKTPTKSRTRTATPMGGVKEVVAVSTGLYHTCAILANDTVKCWGLNNVGQLGYDNISNHGSTMDQMGSNLAAVNLGLGRTAKTLAVEIDTTCALLDNDTVKCWGNNDYGQLGIGDTTTRGTTSGDMAALAAIDLGTGRTASAISAGAHHACAILDTHMVKCWGFNGSGQLGLGDVINRGTLSDQMGDNLPYVDLGAGHTAKLIRAGAYHTCALLDDDSVKCWGDNTYGELGLSDIHNRGDAADEMGDTLPSIDFGNRRVQTIAVGGYSSCALFDTGAVTCWGWNSSGQLGQGDSNNRGDTANEMGNALLNINLGSGHTAKAISIQIPHACAILDDDSVKCWGGNDFGALGYGDTINRGTTATTMGDGLLTVDLGNDLTAKAISLGVNYTCVILNTNNLKCWGDNKYGQLGYNDTYNRGIRNEHMGKYLPPISFGVVLTSTPTSTATKTLTSTKSSTPTKTATSTKTNTPTKTNTRTTTSTKTATDTRTATSNP